MTRRSVPPVAVVASCLVALALGGPIGARSTVMPVSEVRPGMVGVGRTVFRGAAVEEFTVRVIGTLKSVVAPQRDLILAKLEGGPLAETGVIAGMSGSPVYIDGRLVGAVSYQLGQFPKEAIAGITPIAEMTDATALGGARPGLAAGGAGASIAPRRPTSCWASGGASFSRCGPSPPRPPRCW